MKHLTVDEIIDFVSMDQLTPDTLRLASRVNAHIGLCDECLRKVRAFQLVYDEFVRLGKTKFFGGAVKSMEAMKSMESTEAAKAAERVAEKEAALENPGEAQKTAPLREKTNRSLSHGDKNKI